MVAARKTNESEASDLEADLEVELRRDLASQVSHYCYITVTVRCHMFYMHTHMHMHMHIHMLHMHMHMHTYTCTYGVLIWVYGFGGTKLKVGSASVTNRPSLTIIRVSDPVCPDRPTRQSDVSLGRGFCCVGLRVIRQVRSEEPAPITRRVHTRRR